MERTTQRSLLSIVILRVFGESISKNYPAKKDRKPAPRNIDNIRRIITVKTTCSTAIPIPFKKPVLRTAAKPAADNSKATMLPIIGTNVPRA